MNVKIGVTIREEMRDVGVNNEAHTRDNRKRKKMEREKRKEIERRNEVKRVDEMISNGRGLNIYDRRRENDRNE